MTGGAFVDPSPILKNFHFCYLLPLRLCHSHTLSMIRRHARNALGTDATNKYLPLRSHGQQPLLLQTLLLMQSSLVTQSLD